MVLLVILVLIASTLLFRVVLQLVREAGRLVVAQFTDRMHFESVGLWALLVFLGDHHVLFYDEGGAEVVDWFVCRAL